MSNPENAMTTKKIRIASLISTMMALVVADSLVPRISSRPHNTTSRMGGRLTWPPRISTPWAVETIIGERSNSGMCQPNALLRKLFR